QELVKTAQMINHDKVELFSLFASKPALRKLLQFVQSEEGSHSHAELLFPSGTAAAFDKMFQTIHSKEAAPRLQCVIEAVLLTRLADLLLHDEPAIRPLALRFIGQLVAGDDSQTDVVIAAGATPNLLTLLHWRGCDV
ncbi:hypothetical protein OC845_006451, partial [Tilletia horrida]